MLTPADLNTYDESSPRGRWVLSLPDGTAIERPSEAACPDGLFDQLRALAPPAPPSPPSAPPPPPLAPPPPHPPLLPGVDASDVVYSTEDLAARVYEAHASNRKGLTLYIGAHMQLQGDPIFVPESFSLRLVSASSLSSGHRRLSDGPVGEAGTVGGDSIDAGGLSRLFDVSAGASLTLSGLTLRNGRADGAGGAIRARDGANVLLEYVAIEDCRALMVGGAVALVGSAPSQLTMRVVGISGCSAADGASAIESGGGAVLATVISISHACDGAAPPVFGSGDGATWAMRGLKLVADGCSDAEAAQLVPEGVAALACSDRVFTHPFSGTELPICDASDVACVDVPAGDATVPACECEEGAFANPASPQLAPYGATGITTKGCLTPLYLSPPLTLVREEVTVRLLKSGSDFEAASVNVSLQVGGSAWEAAASYSWEVANADVLPEWVHLPAASGPIGCSESPCSVSVPLSILSEGLAERSEPYETNLTVRLKTEEVYEATIDITASIVAEPAECVIDPRGVIDAVYDGAEDLPIALRQRIYDFATFTLSTRDAAGLPLHRNLASRFRLSATVDGEVMRVPEDGTVTLAFAGGGNYTVTLEANRMGYFVVEIEYTQPDGTAELVPAAARILVRAPPHSVPAGWWRASPNTTDLIECSIVPELGSEEWTPCQGGADAGVGGAGYCEVGYAGPRCEVCVNGTHYFDKAVGKCKLCEPLENSALKLLGVASAIFALLFALSPMLRSTYKPRHWALRRPVLVGRRILIRWSQYSMRAKAKNIFTLFQILAVVPSTYEVSLPKELTEWAAVLRWPEFLGLNLFIPGGCYGSYLNRLLVSAFWPIALIGLIILGCVVYVGGRRVRAREPLDREGWRAVLTTALLRALPPCLIVTFVSVPMASMRILRTFTCLHFTVDDITGEGATYLADDLSISCDSPEYKEVEAWAIGLLFLWPLGVPALYAYLLWKCRNAIRTRRPNRLSRATIFLWGDYETRCFWWEPFEILRRLTLTGFVLISTTGYSMMRGLIATLISIAFLMGLSVLVPLRSKIDDALVLGCHLSLVILFVAVLVIKGCTDIPDYCAMYGMGDSPLGASLIFIVYAVCLLGLSMCIAFAFAVIALRRVTALRLNIRSQSSPPDPSLAKGRRFHLFLSHRWATGQDQMAVLKRQLQLVLPGSSVFLDVDDLRHIGDLERYIEESQVILIFLSRGYFKSRNCLREVAAAVAANKPVVLVREADFAKGGTTYEEARLECPPQYRSFVFDGRESITWHRTYDFQRLSVKLIATHLLAGCPNYRKHKFELYYRDELTCESLILPSPVGIYPSPHNAGAAEFVAELATVFPVASLAQSPSPPSRPPSPARNALARLGSTSSADASAVADDPIASWRGSILRSRVRAPPSKPSGLEARYFLLLLNRSIFQDEHGEELAREVRAALHSGAALLLVHEVDEERDGCDFDTFFSITPADLLDSGIFNQMASALHAGTEHRLLSLAVVAQQLGAVSRKSLRGGFITAATNAERAATARLSKSRLLSASGRLFRSSSRKSVEVSRVHCEGGGGAIVVGGGGSPRCSGETVTGADEQPTSEEPGSGSFAPLSSIASGSDATGDLSASPKPPSPSRESRLRPAAFAVMATSTRPPSPSRESHVQAQPQAETAIAQISSCSFV